MKRAISLSLASLVIYACGGQGTGEPAESWSISVVDSFDYPYGKTSLALDSWGKAHISYSKEFSGELMYATNALGIWNATLIDTGCGDSSIAVDSSDEAHVCYRYRADGTLMCASNATGSWVTDTVDSTNGSNVSLALDSSDIAHVGYGAGSDIKYAKEAGGGGWTISTVNTGVSNWNVMAVARDSADNVHMSYDDYDISNARLLYTTYESGLWNTTVIDGSLSPGGYLSGQGSIAVDPGDNVHVIYIDTGPGQIKYANNKTGAWVLEDIPGAVGQDPSMALDAAGNAHVSYYGCTPVVSPCSLMYATNASGAWVIESVDSPRTGARSSIAVAPDGSVHISYHTYVGLSFAGFIKYATKR